MNHASMLYLVLGDGFAWLVLALLAFCLVQLARGPRTRKITELAAPEAVIKGKIS